jgi:putative hydrolase of the HAD superfamily
MSLPSIATPPVPAAPADAEDYALALRHQPILQIDLNEPAPPLVQGYSVLHKAGPSPSSKFQIVPPPGGVVIEYATWHDWDIQHLYDLEHIWVHLSAEGQPVRVEGTMHGMRVAADSGDGLPEMRGARPVLYLEPGKHAVWTQTRPMPFIAGEMIRRVCGPDAGEQGVHLGNRFAEALAYTATAYDQRLARLALKRAAFVPSFAFRQAADVPVVGWPTLEAWIPQRVTALLGALPDLVPHLAAVFLDCGDTLIDEATEVKCPGTEVVLEADEIPHAMDAVRGLYAQGHRIALVADGPRETFENLLKPRGIWQLTEAQAISGDVGALKPSPQMFAAAMDALGLRDEDRPRVVMVGNNLARDIRGANAFGLKSIFVAWSKRRSHQPDGPKEHPDARITMLSQLVPAIDAMELALA